MEVLLSSSTSPLGTRTLLLKTQKNSPQRGPPLISFAFNLPCKAFHKVSFSFCASCFSSHACSASLSTRKRPVIEASSSSSSSSAAAAVSESLASTSSTAAGEDSQRHWMVLMRTPSKKLSSKAQIIDYYVQTLETVLGSTRDAQKCIYDASSKFPFGFCCDIDEEDARQLLGLPGVLSIRPDAEFQLVEKDYNLLAVEQNFPPQPDDEMDYLFPAGTSKHWLVRMDLPPHGILLKSEVLDYFAKTLTVVLGNERDAQMCIYHVSWQSNFGFCCELDEECANELAGMPSVLSVQPDENFGSDDKDYRAPSRLAKVKTKKLFITGLSFYTSDKTLRTAFEGFGDLVAVRVIMDKISKRSKGYAFVEYTTEEAANAALREMNGKIINGWVITVDVARRRPVPPNKSQLKSCHLMNCNKRS